MTKRPTTLFPELTIAHATQIGADAITLSDDGKAIAWLQIMPFGKFSGRDGRGPWVVVDRTHMAVVVAETKKRAGTTEIVVDYDHQTVFSAVPGVGGVAPAAGWIKEYEIRDDGLYGRVEWTEKAAQAIRAGEYRYISPVYQHTKAGEVIRLLSVALTNTPNLDLAAVAARANLNPQEHDMDKIAAALGLAQGADEDAILTAINSVLTSAGAIAVVAGLDKTAKPAETLTAVQAMRTGLDQVAVATGLTAGAKAADIVTAVQSAGGSADPTKFVPVAQVSALQSEIKELRASIDGDKAEVAVNKAIEDGKLVPALKQWGLDLYKADAAHFNTFIAAAPALTATQRAGTASPKGGDSGLTDEDLAVMRQMDISQEAFIKAKKEGDA